MGICANCGKKMEQDTNKYCPDCIEYLIATGKFTYADIWKYKTSDGGCIGCRYILGDPLCENCTRTHTPAPPFVDCYEKGLI